MLHIWQITGKVVVELLVDSDIVLDLSASWTATQNCPVVGKAISMTYIDARLTVGAFMWEHSEFKFLNLQLSVPYPKNLYAVAGHNVIFSRVLKMKLRSTPPEDGIHRMESPCKVCEIGFYVLYHRFGNRESAFQASPQGRRHKREEVGVELTIKLLPARCLDR